MSDSNEKPPQTWNFSMELLSHVHTLRVFLINPLLQPSVQCLHLSAALRSPPPSLFCSWFSPDNSPHQILLPLPLLLFEHSAAPRVLSHVDHIEISVQLLPLSPCQLDAFSSLSIADEHDEGREDRAGFEANVSPGGQGLRGSSSSGNASFICRNCTTEISNKSIRDFVQLPCAEWREVVEHWFGACCCSFGSRAEFLSALYEKSLKLRQGRCFVGSATFYINLQDIDADAVAELHSLNYSAHAKGSQPYNFLTLGNGFMVWASELEKSTEWVPAHCATCLSLVGAYPTKKEGSGYIVEGIHLFKSQISTDPGNCDSCDSCRYSAVEKFLAKELLSRTEENATYRFLIRSLSSKLPLLQLVVLNYKGSIFTGSCIEGAVADAGGMAEHFEFPTKGTYAKSCNSGDEALGEIQDTISLQSCVKVMFLDCSFSNADRRRSSELWAQEHDADTFYMLEELAHKLTREMVAKSLSFPALCELLQGFKVSFLAI